MFPFRLRFEPTGEISFPADSYEQTVFEQLKTVKPDQVLYKVLA